MEAFGAPFDTWTDTRIERFGERVCRHQAANPAPSGEPRPARWEHYFAPDVLQVFQDGYCPA